MNNFRECWTVWQRHKKLEGPEKNVLVQDPNGCPRPVRPRPGNDVFNSSSISGFEFADGSTLTTTELLARGFDDVRFNDRVRIAVNDANHNNLFERIAA